MDVKNRNSFKRIICFYLIKDSIFYEIIITVFQFTQRAIENRSTCHAWHACRRLPTPAIENMQDSLLADTPDEVTQAYDGTTCNSTPQKLCIRLALEFQHLLGTGAIHSGQSLQLLLYPETLRYIRTLKNDKFAPSTQKNCVECTDFWPYVRRHTLNEKDRVRVP